MLKNFIFLMLAIGVNVANAQYYYDRSKNPDQPVKPVIVEKSGRDFDTYYFFSWDNNTPLSNQNYISQASSLGTKLGFRKRLNSIDRLWAGADLGWAVYKKYVPYSMYQYGTQTISTDLYNYAYNTSITVNIDYFFTPTDKVFTPYAGLGIGLAYDKFVQYFNIYGQKIETFGLQVRPEAGILVGFRKNSSWRIKAAVHFDYATNRGKLVDNSFITPTDNDNYNGFMNLGFQLGVVKMAW